MWITLRVSSKSKLSRVKLGLLGIAYPARASNISSSPDSSLILPVFLY